MADREREILARVASGVGAVEAKSWNALTGGAPFLGHAFLASLEDSGSVGPGTGWTPAPMLVEQDGAKQAVEA